MTSRIGAAVAERLVEKRAKDRSWAIRERLREAASKYEKLVNLNKGDPDMPSPPDVIRAGVEALGKNQIKYTEPVGFLDLRKGVAARLKRDHGLEYDPAGEIVITSGVMEGVCSALATILNPGEEVLIGDPYYPAHVTAIVVAGGVPRYIPTYDSQGFEMTVEAVEQAITPKTKAILLANPANPSGSVLSPSRMRELAALVEKNDLVVVADEIYDRFVYDGPDHVSFASVPGMWERTITVNGFSKPYSMTGWRVGYAAGPADVMRPLAEVRHAHSICTSPISQLAALAALSEKSEAYAKNVVDVFGRRRREFMDTLDRAGIRHNRPRATYFLLVHVGETGRSSEDVALELMHRAGVSVWPGQMFGHTIDSYIRLGLVQADEVLRDVANKMSKALVEMREE